MANATRKQIDYIKDLAKKAGYTGDAAYKAGSDIIGNGSWSRWTIAEASQIIDSLKEKIEVAA
jgi:hypothetical protein